MNRSDCLDVAILAPLGRDTELIAALLEEHGIRCRGVSDIGALSVAVDEGVGAVIVTEEAVSSEALAVLEQTLANQAAWSDLPFVVMSGHGVSALERPVAGLAHLGNVTMLDRPVQIRTLLSAIRAALRGRQKQYAARRAIEERDRFLAMLGHELRNPLGAILFAAEKMTRSDRDAPKHAEMVHRQARLLARLVDDLLDVSRVTSGRIALSTRTLDLRELAARSLAAVDTWATARRMHLSRAFDPEPVWVAGDVVRLEQVLSNLLVNAVKYTPERGHIEIAVKRAAGHAELSVRDDGIGISPASLERVFELFAQVESGIDRSQGGLGLGLTLVRRLVELHGGTVIAKSEGAGKGSEFVVRLPLAEQPALAEPAVRAAVRAAMLKVVVIEDNQDIREMLEELLVEEGHSVAAAAEGTAGLTLIVDSMPDLALVDIGLPGIDGYQVATEVRRQVGQRVRMVALSGYGQPEDKARALRAGFDAHLTKPISLDSLHQAMTG